MSNLSFLNNAENSNWTAVVLAGSRPGIDALAQHFGQENKALLEIGGEAMLSRVLRQLSFLPNIDKIIVVAQDAKFLLASSSLEWTKYDKRIQPFRSDHGIAKAVLDILKMEKTASGAQKPVFMTTADNPLLTSAITSEFLRYSQDSDLSVGMVPRAVLEAEYPENRRSWLKFKNGQFTGANLFAMRSTRIYGILAYWDTLGQDRKKLWKIAKRLGLPLLFNIVFKRLTVEQALMATGERLGASAKPVILPHAHAGIDVDKVSDYHLVNQILTRQAA